MTIAFVQSNVAVYNGSTTMSVTLPAPATAGNLILVQTTGAGNNGLSPAGFTLFSTGLYWKIAVGGEQTFGWLSNTLSSTGVLIVSEFSGTDTTAPLSSGGVNNTSGTIPTGPGATPTRPSALYEFYQLTITATGTFGTPAGMTKIREGSASSVAAVNYFQVLANNNFTGSKTTTYSGTLATPGADTALGALIFAANTPPTAPVVTAPNGGETYTTTATITWTASTDAENQTITYDIDYSTNNGGSWTNIVTGTSGTSYVWNTTAIPASTACLVRVRARDTGGLTSAYDSSNAVFTIYHNQAPNPATWASPVNNSTLDRAVSQTFTFNFLDPDVGDVMTKFDYRYRLVGAGTWTTTGTQSGSTPSFTIAGGTLAAGTYEIQVLTYDGQGLAASNWSASLQFVMATAPAAPAITTPPSGGTVGASNGVAAWTVGAQTGYQVQQIADNAGVMADPNVPANVYSDTGQVTGAGAVTARNTAQTYPINNRYEWARVRIQAGGLWSAWTSVRYQVSYTPPAAITLAVSAPTTSPDLLRVAVTNPTPTGTQPVVTAIELWRQRISDQAGGVIASETPVRVANVAPTAGSVTTIDDPTVASGNGYQYQAIVIGANSTVTRSPWVS